MSVLYGTFHALIVGRRYYCAQTATGQQVDLVREPFNPYDANAIAACQLDGSKLGHLPRWLAELLAPCMDKFRCTLKGTVSGTGNTFVTPINLSIYAPSSMSSQLLRALGSYWSLWQLSVPKASSLEVKPAANHDSNMLVISTSAGICDWVSLLDSTYTDNLQRPTKWIIYDPLMPVENIAQYKIVFVRIADAAHLLSQTEISTWSHVTLDKTAIGEGQLMAALPSLKPVLNATKALLI
ncbi:hypothetical protein EV183_002105 [Coemansia sp. RSA 2336]|nr:hypothetical protein EV183_002105 [Coemansia sp. RSA 2336]